MKVLGALLIGLLLLPALAFGQAFNFPDAPTLNQQVGGPGAQIYKWDGTKWLTVPSGASLAGPYPDGSTWSATGLSGLGSLTVGTPTGGNMGAGSINATGIYVNGAAVGGGGAPLTNPAGGQNNYAPLASPTFTGTVTVPDASTLTSTGYNNVKGIGIGTTVGGNNAGDLLDMLANIAGIAQMALKNTSTAANATAEFDFLNSGAQRGSFGFTGTGYSSTNIQGNSLYFYMNAASPASMSFWNQGQGPIQFIDGASGTTVIAKFQNGLILGAPTGGDKGTGTLNATGLYINNVALTGLATAAIPLSIANGGTNATTAGAALTSLGAAPLASPVFTGTPSLPTGTTGVTQTAGNSSTALATTAFVATSFAPLASPALTGTPTAPTATVGTNTTQIATTAFVLANAATVPVSIANGGTGQTTAAAALTALGGFPLVGTTAGGNAAAGNVGEVIKADMASNVTLATGSQTAITSISLTAGDWDVRAGVFLSCNAATLMVAAINNAVATPTTPPYTGYARRDGTGMTTWNTSIGPERWNLTSTTTINLIGQYTGGTSCLAQGTLEARRAR